MSIPENIKKTTYCLYLDKTGYDLIRHKPSLKHGYQRLFKPRKFIISSSGFLNLPVYKTHFELAR